MELSNMVSVYVLAYNHEKYIAHALESIVMQKTSFPFEVIVHDDASTDSTAEIIHEFENHYPDIVKAIYQTENQYSQKVPIFSAHILPKVTGKYIACCEGDDYWVDPLKLQKQVDYMEAHPDCTFCFTNGWVEDQTGKTPKRKFIPFHKWDEEYYIDEDKIFTLDDTYQMSFVPTASFMMRADSFLKLPETYGESCAYGDLKNRLFHIALGYGYYMKDTTCVYRFNVPGSALSSWKSDARKTAYLRYKGICRMINNVDVFTEHRHSEALWHFEKMNLRLLLLNAPSLKVLLQDLKIDKYKRALRECSFADRIKVFIKAVLPETAVKWFRYLKRNILK